MAPGSTGMGHGAWGMGHGTWGMVTVRHGIPSAQIALTNTPSLKRLAAFNKDAHGGAFVHVLVAVQTVSKTLAELMPLMEMPSGSMDRNGSGGVAASTWCAAGTTATRHAASIIPRGAMHRGACFWRLKDVG